MSCKDKDGGTHHNACDCREAYFRKLEKVAEAAAEIEDMLQVPENLGYTASLTCELAIDKFRDTLASLHQPEGKRA